MAMSHRSVRTSALLTNSFILNKTKIILPLKQEEKVEKVEKKESVTFHIEPGPCSFSPCKVSNKASNKRKEPAKKIEAVFTWDVDKTLIDENGNLLFSDQVKQLLQTIKNHGFANYIVTARPHVKAHTDSTHPFSVNYLRERLGQDLFDGTYYTNGHDKDLVLDKILEDLELDTPTQLCHIDDDEGFLAPIREKGYIVAKVKNLRSDEHLAVVENQLRRMIMLKNMTEEDFINLRAAKRPRIR